MGPKIICSPVFTQHVLVVVTTFPGKVAAVVEVSITAVSRYKSGRRERRKRRTMGRMRKHA